MQAIMLAAGKGSRLGKYTKNNTKCMLNVHGKTLLERAIDALLEANIKDFILVLGYKGDNVKRYIEENEGVLTNKIRKPNIHFLRSFWKGVI